MIQFKDVKKIRGQSHPSVIESKRKSYTYEQKGL